MNPMHIVNNSPWPILVSITLMTLMLNPNLLACVSLFLLIFQWFRDIIRESQQGFHTNQVQKGLLKGFILFLVTEIMLFLSFFWCYFHSSLTPSLELALIWPPLGIYYLDPWSLPLLLSVLLLSSGFTLTQSHNALLQGKKIQAIRNIKLTLFLGLLFLSLQFTEYINGQFDISDSVYSSIFYITTGLHALHVLGGLLFLLIQSFRLFLDHLTLEHHLSYELALFYYHLVDLVWLFLFFTYSFSWWGTF